MEQTPLHPYPLNVASITSIFVKEWLTEVLRGKLFNNDDSVIEFTYKTLGEGLGFMSEIYRLTLTLSSSTSTTLVAKFPNSLGKSTGSNLSFYSTEVAFYSYYQVDSGRQSPIPIPKCYFVTSDILLYQNEENENKEKKENSEIGANFCILMEDCFPAEVGDQVRGLSAKEMEKALTSIAKFHATWWKTPKKELLEDPKIKPWISNLSLTQFGAPLIPMGYPNFLSYLKKFIFPSEIDPIIKEVGDMLLDVLSNGQSFEENFTFVHGDFRPDNMLFLRQTLGENERKVEEFYTVDFQTLHRGNPMEDVSYLLSCGVTFDVLKENQDHFLKVYHDSLISEREDIDYSFDKLKFDYREYLMYSLILPILNSNTIMREMESDSAELTSQQQRTRELTGSWTQRVITSIIHNDPRDILPDVIKRHSSACKGEEENELDKKLDGDYKGLRGYMNMILPSPDWENYSVEKSRESVAGFVKMIEDQKKMAAVDQVEIIDHQIKLNDRNIQIRIYFPTEDQILNSKNEKNDRLGFYFHSGWVNGEGCGRLDDINIRKWVSTSSRPIVTFDHRLAPEFSHDQIVDDCLQVFLWIVDRNNSKEKLKMEVKEVVLIGLYQGGNLAAKLSLSALSLNLSHFISKQVLLFPLINPKCESESMNIFAKKTKTLEKGTCKWSWKKFLQISLDDQLANRKLENFSIDPKVNLLSVDDVTLSKIPKTIILLAEQSVLRDEVNEFVDKIKGAGGDVLLHLFEGVGDGFFVNMIEKGRCAINEVAEHLKLINSIVN